MTRRALILAGSRAEGDPLATAEGVSHKALIGIDGRTMLARVAAALRRAGYDEIAVSTGDAAVVQAAASLDLRILPAAAGPSESVASGLAALGAPLLVTTADHALLEATWIDAFVEAVPPGADLAALLARRERIEHDLPGSRRTYLRFADGDWSGCNLFYLATPRAAAALALWRQVEADRKRPWRIVRRLGVSRLLRYLTGRLTLADAVAHLGRLAGIQAAVVESPYGLAAVDVDKADDLVAVRALTAPDDLDGTLFRLLEARGRIADLQANAGRTGADAEVAALHRSVAAGEAALPSDRLRAAATRGDALAQFELIARGLPPEQSPGR